MPEPTVLDYVKAKLIFWRRSELVFPVEEKAAPVETSPAVELPREEIHTAPAEDSIPEAPDRIPAAEGGFAAVQPAIAAPPEMISIPTVVEPARVMAGFFPWRSSLALVIALIGQVTLNPPARNETTGIVCFMAAAALAVWGWISGEWALAPLQEDERPLAAFSLRRAYLIAALVMSALTFIVFTGGLFTPVSVMAWFATMGLFVAAFWSPGSQKLATRVRQVWKGTRWTVHIAPVTGLLALAILLVIFLRVYRLSSVPPEMVSDHAEKLLDVYDVMHGNPAVYFPRNTGREFFQFYLTAAVITLFNTGFSFLSLKIGTVFMGLFTLPFIYLIGKEVGNRRVGWIALFFAGIAYWPNVISRIALRFTLYPAFVAPCLYFLIRGLRRSNRNDFILSGLFLGLGLHGYTSYRITPLVVIAAVVLYLLHRQSVGVRLRAVYNTLVLAAVSFAVFLPLFRYATENWDMFVYRTMTRVGTIESPLPGSPVLIFLKNLWNACIMFFWSDGDVWVHSVPIRPALDTITAALFFLGIVLVVARYIKRRNWLDLFLVVSIPLLMLPSILSLAFPAENPSLNRTAGALVPVFVVMAMGLETLLASLRDRLGGRLGKLTAAAVALVLVVLSVQQNYQLVFDQYAALYRNSSWNTSEMGRILRGFADSIGSTENEWVVAYPYWVDTRLVGINAGLPTRDTAIDRDKIANTTTIPGPKLFLVNLQDQESLALLQQTYPLGHTYTYPAVVPDKNFTVFLTPQ